MNSLDLAYIDRPHYARRNAFRPAASNRSTSPFSHSASRFRRSRPLSSSSGNSSDDSSRLTVADMDHPRSENSIPVYNSRAQSGATHTGPKGVIADWRLATSIYNAAGHHNANLSALLKLTNRAPSANTLSLDVNTERSESLGAESISGRESGRESLYERRVSGKVFGHLREIGVKQFLGAIEEASSIAVVIHLYEPAFEDCELLNYHLASIARAYPHTKFLRALASEMDYATGLEEAALPTILVYREGELVTTIVGVHREWGFGTRPEILSILVDNKTVSSIPTIPFNGSRGNSQNSSRRSSAESAISYQ